MFKLEHFEKKAYTKFKLWNVIIISAVLGVTGGGLGFGTVKNELST